MAKSFKQMIKDGEVRRADAIKVQLEDLHEEPGFNLRMEGDAFEEAWVPAFEGSDADRVARIITSQENEKLSPLELAEGYKRLRAFGWSVEQIATKVGKTRQHVEQVLTVGNANTDVQNLVAAGHVSATTAAQVVREHGDDAGKVLGAELEKAQAARSE